MTDLTRHADGIGDDFIIDREREKFFLTFNPKGYLLTVGPETK